MTQFGLVVGTDVSEEYTAPIFRTKVIQNTCKSSDIKLENQVVKELCMTSYCDMQIQTVMRAVNRNYTLQWFNIQSVTAGTDQTSGECSLGQTIPI